MATLIEGSWWARALWGAALALFGGLTVAWPQATLAVLIVLLGAVMLADGVFWVVNSLANRGRELWC